MATPHDVAACAYGEFIENVADLLNRFEIRPESFKDNDKFLNGVYVAEEKQLSFDENDHKWIGTVFFDDAAGSWRHDVHWYDKPHDSSSTD